MKPRTNKFTAHYVKNIKHAFFVFFFNMNFQRGNSAEYAKVLYDSHNNIHWVTFIKMTKDTEIIMETTSSTANEIEQPPIEFIPTYLPNSTISEKNSSENFNVPAGGLNDKKVLPYPAIPPPPYPLNILPKLYPPIDTNSENPLRIVEYDNNIERGLTSLEKDTTRDLFKKLQKTGLSTSPAERKEFSDAEDKLIELLREAQPRLTISEKEGILKEVRNINQMKKNRDLERFKEERKICDCEEDSDTEYAVDFWAIVLKIPQLAMILIAFQKNITFECSHFGNIFNVICLTTALCSACLLIFYCSCRKPSMLILVFEFIYCCTCFVVFLIFSINFIWDVVQFFGSAATIAYGCEMLTKFHAMYRKQNSLDKTHPKVLRFKKYRKWQYWFPKERTSNIGNRQRSESSLSLNFLDDKSYKKISVPQQSSKNSNRIENSDHSIED